MRPARRALALAAPALTVAAPLVASGPAGAAAPARAAASAPRAGAYTFAVIGDIPYGADQVARFPGWIQQINADPHVRSWSPTSATSRAARRVCSDEYFATIRHDFDRFADPLVYTPGDNEWTDCHRANNGGLQPARAAGARPLGVLRPARPTLGEHRCRSTLAGRPRAIPENVALPPRRRRLRGAARRRQQQRPAAVDRARQHRPTPEQSAEVHGPHGRPTIDEHARHLRPGARAPRPGRRACMQQADMFDPTVHADRATTSPRSSRSSRRSSTSRPPSSGPVYLFNGDSHVYNSDQPLAAGSPWLATYGVPRAADKLTRVTVDGSSNNDDYLRVRVGAPGEPLLSWQRVAYTS